MVIVGAMIIAVAKSKKIIGRCRNHRHGHYVLSFAIPPGYADQPAPLDGSRGKNMTASRIRWFRLGSFAGCSEGRRPGYCGGPAGLNPRHL
jgi:hypothetical protein